MFLERTTYMIDLTLKDIEQAAQSLHGRSIETPTIAAPLLSDTLGCELFLKLENLQYTSSFKARGACLAIERLDEAQRARGVITMSAGNHAQAVAYRATQSQVKAVIVMPEQTPFAKIARTKSFGGEVILHGRNLNECESVVKEQMDQHGYTLIHPYNDRDVIRGQGTVGLEMLKAVSDLDCLVIPIGGGGLFSGIAIVAKALNPNIKIYGVESALYPSMTQIIAGADNICGGETLAEGIAVKTPGTLTRPIVEAHAEAILLVDELSLEWAVGALAEQQRVVSEGAGAAGIAAIYAHPDLFKGKKVGTIICGGNIDIRLLGSILMRNMVSDGRLARLRIDISDEPGRLAAIAGAISAEGGNVVEVYHHRLFYNVPAKLAKLDIVVDTHGSEHVARIIAALEALGFRVSQLDEQSL